ncbi:pyridoxamine 5'-phosphate oxidase family protein, partial [Mycobacterium bohemicum]
MDERKPSSSNVLKSESTASSTCPSTRSPVARLATASPDGTPHLVPVVFAVEGMAVDFWLLRRDSVSVGTDDEAPGLRLAV